MIFQLNKPLVISSIVCFFGGITTSLVYGALTKPKTKEKTGDKNVLYLIDKKPESTFNSLFSNSEDIYKLLFEKLNSISESEPVDIIIKTNGGSLLWCMKICQIIKNRSGLVRVFVKDYAHSAGSIISLVADKLYINPNASLSAIDPQVSVTSYLSYISAKDIPNLVTGDFKEKVGNHFKKFTDYYSEQFAKIINDKYNITKIVDEMYHKPVEHSILFFEQDLSNLDITIDNWDGENIPPRPDNEN